MSLSTLKDLAVLQDVNRLSDLHYGPSFAFDNLAAISAACTRTSIL
jgi:hypothetical protein